MSQNARRQPLAPAWCFVLALVVLIWVAGCGPVSKPTKTAPAVVTDSQGKAAFASEPNQFTVTLTEDAFRRLDIAAGLAQVERKAMPRKQTLGGDAIVPPGRGVRVAAPLAGTVHTAGDALARPGQRVQEGAAILRFTPVLSPDAKVNLVTAAAEAQQQVKSAKIQLQLTQATLKRTQELASERSVSDRVLEEAVAARDLADQTVKASVARQALLDKVLSEAASGTETTLELSAPVTGIIQRMAVAPGEAVSAGAELFEVVQIDPLWVRVPIYAGAGGELNLSLPAEVRPLGAPPKSTPIAAQPVQDAPPAADPLAASIDVYYRLNNAAGEFRPGQKVVVTLTARGASESLVVPWSAVVYDIHGGSWVYEQIGDRSFRRRRVEVLHVAGAEAVLQVGPAAGASVATGGVVELLGAELGFGAQK